jgi:hypothetical protein
MSKQYVSAANNTVRSALARSIVNVVNEQADDERSEEYVRSALARSNNNYERSFSVAMLIRERSDEYASTRSREKPKQRRSKAQPKKAQNQPPKGSLFLGHLFQPRSEASSSL